MYGVYLYIAYSYGVAEVGKMGRGSPGILGRRKVVGREAGVAVLIGFAVAVMTLSKTVLYCTYLATIKVAYVVDLADMDGVQG